jgi:hypothetical protein
MKGLRTHPYLIPAVILLVGLGSAVVIYLTVPNNSADIAAYEAEGGYLYPISPEDSKAYLRNLELFGGKTNVLAREFIRWFDGLWHGKSLAFTVAFITILISVGFLLASDSRRHGP